MRAQEELDGREGVNRDNPALARSSILYLRQPSSQENRFAVTRSDDEE